MMPRAHPEPQTRTAALSRQAYRILQFRFRPSSAIQLWAHPGHPVIVMTPKSGFILAAQLTGFRIRKASLRELYNLRTDSIEIGTKQRQCLSVCILIEIRDRDTEQPYPLGHRQHRAHQRRACLS